MKDIIVLGASGSIGLQTLDLLKYSYDYSLIGITFYSNYEKIEEYLPYFSNLKYIGIIDNKKANEFKNKYQSYEIISGCDANIKLLEKTNCDVFNSILGNSGLLPSLYTLNHNRDLLLSNKESLVIGSSLIKQALKNSKGKIYPVDSEHVALAKLLFDIKKQKINKTDILNYVITASGGALRDYDKKDLNNIKPVIVLNHPTWNMGNKITVDSSTLINKAFEVIEASILFKLPLNKIKPIICYESLVHAMIEFKDKTNIKEYSPVDMKVSIAYALSKGKLSTHQINKDDEKRINELHFKEIDYSFYPCFKLAINMYKKYHDIGMLYFNALDTLLVNAFINNQIKYTDIYKGLKYLYLNFDIKDNLTIDNISLIEEKANIYAKKIIDKKEYI